VIPTELAGQVVVDYASTPEWGAASATFSPDLAYRYALWRCWDIRGSRVTFVMLNPSTADAFTVDPTVRRCLGFAKMAGAGSMTVVNLYALRSTDPKVLYTHPDSIGHLNNEFIRDAALQSDVTIAGWGAHGAFMGRGPTVRRFLTELGVRLRCLRITKGGHPGHPLYLPADSPLLPYPTEMPR
jgi:hypothetical protein